MKGAPKPVKSPRKLGEVGRAVADTLSAYGISGARFYKRKHARVEFELFDEGETLVFTFSCTPRAPQSAARQTVRLLERRIIEGIARAHNE